MRTYNCCANHLITVCFVTISNKLIASQLSSIIGLRWIFCCDDDITLSNAQCTKCGITLTSVLVIVIQNVCERIVLWVVFWVVLNAIGSACNHQFITRRKNERLTVWLCIDCSSTVGQCIDIFIVSLTIVCPALRCTCNLDCLLIASYNQLTVNYIDIIVVSLSTLNQCICEEIVWWTYRGATSSYIECNALIWSEAITRDSYFMSDQLCTIINLSRISWCECNLTFRDVLSQIVCHMIVTDSLLSFKCSRDDWSCIVCISSYILTVCCNSTGNQLIIINQTSNCKYIICIFSN